MHQNIKTPLGYLHLLAEIKECKPQDLYMSIFGQHDLGKNPMGKTSWKINFIMEISR
jgi:hypothetical protein